MQIRRVLALCFVVTLATSGMPAFAQKAGDQKQQKRSKAEQADIDAILPLVDGVQAGSTPAPADVAISWESNHFMKGQGVTYVPYTLTIDRSKLTNPNSTTFYVRVVDKNGAAPAAAAAPAADKKDEKSAAPAARPQYAFETIQWVKVPDDGKLSRALVLMPGDYDAFILVKDKAVEKPQKGAPPAKVGLVRHELKVPDYNAGLASSTPILAKAIEPLPSPLKPEEQQENPYTLGQVKITPSADGKFSKSGELTVIFFIYGNTEATGGKPDVQLEYAFYQKTGDTEKYFNKTAPQQLNGQTLPPGFSTAAGHQLQGDLTVPLASFPEGDYRLEIKITDKPSSKTITQNVTFSVVS